jgi:hypothetical protein
MFRVDSPRENDEKNEKEELENLCHVWNTTAPGLLEGATTIDC